MLSREGKYLAATQYRGVLACPSLNVWEIATGRLVNTHISDLRYLAFTFLPGSPEIMLCERNERGSQFRLKVWNHRIGAAGRVMWQGRGRPIDMPLLTLRWVTTDLRSVADQPPAWARG